MRIVVTGLVASFPLGGVAWDYLAYVDGFRRLGCDVLYLEDTGQWLYDPTRETFTDDPNRNIRWLVDALDTVAMPSERFAVRVPDGTFYGAGRQAVTSFCQSADLFLNVSGSCWLRDEYRGATCTAYLDSDPGYTQAKLLAQERGQATDDESFSVALIRQHDRFFTFAENIGQPDCAIPDGGLSWIPTRQPVVLEHWPFSFDADAGRFTTVMSWKTDVSLPMIDGVRYGGKDVEFSRFVELPRRTTIAMEVAISGAAPLDRLRACGWRVVSAHEKSVTMDTYRTYLRQARGEWSVVQERLRGAQEWLVQWPQRGIPRAGEARGGSGHRLEQVLSNRGRPVRLRDGRGGGGGPGDDQCRLPASLRCGSSRRRKRLRRRQGAGASAR